MPGTGSGADGSAVTRQRVTDAVGWPKSAASVARRQRRTAIPIVPDVSAASCSRREAVIDRRATSATTPPSPPCRRPASPAGEHRLLVAGLDMDHPIGMQPGLAQGRREQVGPGHAPEDRAGGTGDDPGREQRRCRTVDRAIGATGHLVQGAKRQPAVRQAGVDGRHPERQHASAHMTAHLDRSDARAQLIEGGTGPHGRGRASWLMARYVPSLFSHGVGHCQSGFGRQVQENRGESGA